jgi:hypothetical protein
MDEERRGSARARLLRRARIVFQRGRSSVDCVVLDLSAGGARLKLSGLLGLPDRFELRLDNGLRREVEIRHRGVETTGVAFIDTAA